MEIINNFIKESKGFNESNFISNLKYDDDQKLSFIPFYNLNQI